SPLVLNFRAHGLVGRLETPSVKPKERPACREQVAHGSTDRSWSAGFGLLTIAPREVAIRSLQLGAAQHGVLTRCPWSLGTAAGCLMGRSCGGSIGLPPDRSGQSAALLLLLTGLLLSLFGLPTGLLLLSTGLHCGLVHRSCLGTLRALALALRTLSLTLLVRATLLLELRASGHTL